MDVVTMLAGLAFNVFVVVAVIRIVIAIWNLKEREERIIEQNEKQLDLLEQVVKAMDQPKADPKDRD